MGKFEGLELVKDVLLDLSYQIGLLEKEEDKIGGRVEAFVDGKKRHGKIFTPMSFSELEENHQAVSSTNNMTEKESSNAGSRGFLEERDAAFASLEQCFLSGQGYCDLIYESLHAVAQCEGNLGTCDCSECVNNAVEIAQNECGYAVSGDIYLDSCYISYGYNKNGINGGLYGDGDSSGTSTKLIAIVVGGIAAAALAVFLCYLFQSWGKKKDDLWKVKTRFQMKDINCLWF